MRQEEIKTVRNLMVNYCFESEEITCDLVSDLRDLVWSDYCGVSNLIYKRALFVDYIWLCGFLQREFPMVSLCNDKLKI